MYKFFCIFSNGEASVTGDSPLDTGIVHTCCARFTQDDTTIAQVDMDFLASNGTIDVKNTNVKYITDDKKLTDIDSESMTGRMFSTFTCQYLTDYLRDNKYI